MSKEEIIARAAEDEIELAEDDIDEPEPGYLFIDGMAASDWLDGMTMA